ncbi:MAG: thioredoxin family protein [Candidatus Micrarchaeota archaeon]|nr:thioredoxin family protein [Candidatus Micrarchaeota archaeon]
MGLLDDNTKKEVREFLKAMESRIRIVFFDSTEGQYSGELNMLLDEIREATDKIELEKHDFEKDRDMAKKYEVDMAPVIIFEGKNRGKVRFYGIPSGHEFGGFLSTIVETSKGDTVEFSEDLKAKIKGIDFPLRLDVFITPQCPYCPGAVRLAQAMAILNKNVTGSGVEAVEFSEWADKNSVRSVPKTVIIANGKKVLALDGLLAPDMLLDRIMDAI